MAAVHPRNLVALTLALASTLACQDPPAREQPAADAQAAAPEPAPEPAPAPAPAPPEPAPPEAEQPAPPSDPDPVVAERKLALANVGRAAFDALKAGEFAALRELTPLDPGPLRDACPGMPLSDSRELEARFNHCHQTIAWDAVAEAQVFAGVPSGDQAGGCEDGIEDYGRLQLFLHMSDGKFWRVDFFGAVGQDGKAVGINGELACQQVDEVPKL